MNPDNSRPILIVKTGEAIYQVEADGDFEDWITAGMGLNGAAVRVCRVVSGEELPDPVDLSGVVITGSPAMVTDRLDWSERTSQWLRDAVSSGLPILGICYGHQLLADALGGKVERDPAGREIGTVEVELHQSAQFDPLLVGLPKRFFAHATHEQSVIDLPPGAVQLAESGHPAIHVFRVGSCAWGVQFHPEFDDDVMKSYLRGRAAVIKQEGLDPDALLNAVRPAPVAAGILRRFAEIALN